MMPTASDKLDHKLWLQRSRCYYCELTMERDLPEAHPQRATLDHKVPRSRGGTWSNANLVAACRRCNHEKADLPYEVWGAYRRLRQEGVSDSELREVIAKVLGKPMPELVRAKKPAPPPVKKACPMHVPPPYRGVVLNPWWARA